MLSSDEKYLIKKFSESLDILDRLENIHAKIIKDKSELELIKERLQHDFNEKMKLLKEKSNELIELKNELLNDLEKIISEKTIQFPWLSEAIAKYFEFRDEELADYLRTKKYPAKKAAEIISEIKLEKSQLRKYSLLVQNKCDYYESLFPWLPDFVDASLEDEFIESLEHSTQLSVNDPVKNFLTEGEYSNLTVVEKNQLALDRYLSRRNKSKWRLGRDYERYVGYVYEKKGWEVEYIGIEKKKEDMGRDLICKKSPYTEIIQCKYWSKEKTIHEKHINQLFGTTIEYIQRLREHLADKNNPEFNTKFFDRHFVKPVLIINCGLSETARDFAKILNVKVLENFKLKKYPIIKCNVNEATHERIYHLPFDQQYDKTKIIIEKGERYVETVAEAEELGFRRAWRWHGIN